MSGFGNPELNSSQYLSVKLPFAAVYAEPDATYLSKIIVAYGIKFSICWESSHLFAEKRW